MQPAIVGAACSLYNEYGTISFFGQTAQLEAQIIQIQQQKQQLSQQPCPSGSNPDEYNLRQQKVIQDLQNEQLQLTQQYADANKANIVGGLVAETGCAGAAALALLILE